MRAFIKDFVRVAAQTLPISDPIYEFGSYETEGQEGFANLRSFFPGRQYIGTDMRWGPGVDKIIDLHRIDLADECIGTAILMDTLEHVEYPHLAVQEVFRVLRPGGTIVMSSVMNFPIHDFPYDYWRFTPTAFQSLLKNFPTSWVEIVGAENFPHTVVGVGIKGNYPLSDKFLSTAELWKQSANRPTKKQVLRQFIPPIIMNVYDRAIKKK